MAAFRDLVRDTFDEVEQDEDNTLVVLSGSFAR